MNKIREEILKTREGFITEMAKQLCSVQPMDGDILKNLYENAMTEEELVSQGYKPVCEGTRLMFIKKDCK